MRTRRAALELGMALARNEPRVIGKLDHLSQAAVGRHAGDDEAGILKAIAEGVVHLVAMAMALVDDLLAVRLERAR